MKWGKLKMSRPKAILIEKTVIIAMLMVIAACVMVSMATKSVESAIWTEAKLAARQIKLNAQLLCSEKGTTWTDWKDASIHDLDFTTTELDGYYFKHDSYSIQFLGPDDFLIKVKVTPTTKESEHLDKCTLSLDDHGIWEYIEKAECLISDNN